MRIDGTETSESWEAIYQAGDAGWDIKKAAPPFEELIETHQELIPPGKIICFGAGKGHDANFFASKGFSVTAVDFAPSAVEAINKYAESNEKLNAFQGDILKLPFGAEFDYVLEHTCYCAIPRQNRPQYVESAWKVLKPGGLLFGLFYRFDPEDDKGPPHTTSESEIDQLFGGKFEILEMFTPKNSHGRRQGRERLIIMKKKMKALSKNCCRFITSCSIIFT